MSKFSSLPKNIGEWSYQDVYDVLASHERQISFLDDFRMLIGYINKADTAEKASGITAMRLRACRSISNDCTPADFLLAHDLMDLPCYGIPFTEKEWNDLWKGLGFMVVPSEYFQQKTLDSKRSMGHMVFIHDDAQKIRKNFIDNIRNGTKTKL